MRAAEIVDLNPAMTDAQQRPVAQAESSGGTVSLEALFAFKETVFRICLGHSRDYAEAEDLSQEVYLRAYRGLPDLREPSRAREWLFRIARNACLDRQKRNRNRGLLLRRLAHESAVLEDPLPDADAPDERIGLLKTAVRRLPKKMRDVFVFREYGGLAYEEIAVTLGLKKGTVMSRLNRARRRIAAAIKEKTDDRH